MAVDFLAILARLNVLKCVAEICWKSFQVLAVSGPNVPYIFFGQQLRHEFPYISHTYEFTITGWWFGTWILFFHSVGKIFFRGVGIPPTSINIWPRRFPSAPRHPFEAYPFLDPKGLFAPANLTLDRCLRPEPQTVIDRYRTGRGPPR